MMSSTTVNKAVDHDASVVIFTRDLHDMMLIESSDDMSKYNSDEFIVMDHVDVRSSWMTVLTMYADFRDTMHRCHRYVQRVSQPMCRTYKECHLSEILTVDQMCKAYDARHVSSDEVLLMRGVDPSFVRCPSIEVANMVCSVDSRYIDIASDLFKTPLIELLKKVAKEKLILRCANTDNVNHDVDEDIDHDVNNDADDGVNHDVDEDIDHDVNNDVDDGVNHDTDEDIDHSAQHRSRRVLKNFNCIACGSSFKDGYHLRRHENTKKHRRNIGLIL